MQHLLMPDFIFEKFDDITPAFLLGEGIRALLIDIDNTLAPYEQPEPDERILAWFESLREHGIAAALISNNDHERVERFNRDLGLIAFAKSGKPLKKNLVHAMALMSAVPESTAVLGDQLFTDVLGGKLLGLRAIVVPPIKDKKTLFFRFKRLLEKPVLHAYHKRKG